jgi:dTDP-4-amino-4,6-dideoxygalactose transaminase
MAAIALVSLRYLDRDNAYRRQLAKWYEDSLSDSELISIVKVAEGCESSRHLFQVRVSHRDQVLMALNEYGIYPGVHYRDNTEYKVYKQSTNTCPNSSLASKEILSLPMHMHLTKKDVLFISKSLQEIVHKNAGM